MLHRSSMGRARHTSAAPLMLGPLLQRIVDPREHERVHGLDVGEAITDDARLVADGRVHLVGEAMEACPTAEPGADDLDEEVRCEGVIIAAVANLADAFGDPAIEETSGLGADAGLAHGELLGEVVEGAGLIAEEEGAEESAGDTREAVGFGGESHAFDEGVSVGGCHEGSDWSVQYKLNVTPGPAV